MPSIVTHHLFAEDVLNKLPKLIQKSINPSLNEYYIFAQSFDNLFYYQFFRLNAGYDIQHLGHIAQETNTNLYFKSILNEAKKYPNDTSILAYLYGSICHYILDSNCHPYIFYYSKTPEFSLKYRGWHERMEVNIDAYMLKKKQNKDLKDASLASILLPDIKFSDSLINCLDTVYQNTFQASDMGHKYNKCVHTGNIILKYFVTDHTGIKKGIYTIKDMIMYESHRKYQYLSFHVNINPIYLNQNHEEWHNPVNNMASTESFEDLYQKSIAKAVILITDIHKYLNHKISYTDILQEIGNNSYSTGLDCNNKLPMKYFHQD